MSDTSSPAPIRRAAKTYGRRRDPLTPDPDTSFADTSILSNDVFYTPSSKSSVELPPNSDFDASPSSELGGRDADDVEVAHESRGYQFEWRKKLEDLDKSDDEDLENVPSGNSLHREHGLSDIDTTVPLQSPLDDTFGGPSLLLSSQSNFEKQSNSPSPFKSRIDRTASCLEGSESEKEVGPSSTPQTPPRTLHYLSTPPSRLSKSSPPTSLDMAKKGKRRVKAASVSPTFGDDASNASGHDETSQSKEKKPRKRKGLSKKEALETQKATARIVAGQDAVLPRRTKIIAINELFSKIQSKPSNAIPSSSAHNMLSSDPIDTYSSPNFKLEQSLQLPHRETSTVEIQPFAGLEEGDHNDSDDELPSAAQLLQHVDETKRMERLRSFKERAAVMQALQRNQEADDSDDDLVIAQDMHAVAREEAENRRHLRVTHLSPSKGKQKQLNLAHRSSFAATPKSPTLTRKQNKLPSVDDLVAAAAPSFSVDQTRKRTRINPASLNRTLLDLNGHHAEQVKKVKEHQWIKLGGRVAPQPEGKDLQTALAEVTAKAAENIIDGGDVVEEEEDLVSDDGDWGENSDKEEDTEDAGPGFVIHQSQDTEEEEEENIPLHVAKPRRSAIVDSDEEDGMLVVLPQPLSNHSSHFDANEDTDKENDASQTLLCGEDKENDVALPLSSQNFLARRLSFSGDNDEKNVDLSEPRDTGRPPLSEILDGDDPFHSPTLPLDTPGRPQQFLNSLSLAMSPLLHKESDIAQSDSEERDGPNTDEQGLALDLSQPAAQMKSGGLSQLFVSGSLPQPPPVVNNAAHVGGFSQFFTPAKDNRSLQKAGMAAEPVLSLDPTLQPALDVTGSVKRKADMIFGKEQEFVVEDVALQQPTPNVNGKKMYIDANGFLTQTRPDADSPLTSGLRSPPSIRASGTGKVFASSPFSVLGSVRRSVQRKPLAPLELDSDSDDLPNAQLGGRLKKRRLSMDNHDVADTFNNQSPSPSPTKSVNAFDTLMQKRPPKIPALRPLQKSDFVAGEAEESDDDDMFGFGLPKPKGNDEEEEDGDHLDQTLIELMDDKVMDENTLNVDGVLEKVKEHQEEDDAAVEKFARDLAAGKNRERRRNRAGLDDSDDSDDDEDNARRRQRMAKKRRIEGDCLDEIAKDPAAKAFVAAYEEGLDNDDNADFVHLDREDTDLGFIHKNEEMEGEEEEEDEEEPEFVSKAQLDEELRAAARGKKSLDIMDVEDLSYLDNDDDDGDDPMLVQEVVAKGQRANGERVVQNGWERELQRPQKDKGKAQGRVWESWARSERGSRSATGSVRTGASAITGHSKSTKAGNGSVIGRNQQTKPNRKEPAKLVKSQSALSAVSSRRDRFGS
ncbi:MRC1-like domain-containing protein [Abortiporus biennis]|nr:MRC1-like domain-containing protein [Abortiporus biennis]